MADTEFADCKAKVSLRASPIPHVAWAPSDSSGLNNGQRESRTWSSSTLRLLIVWDLSGKQVTDN